MGCVTSKPQQDTQTDKPIQIPPLTSYISQKLIEDQSKLYCIDNDLQLNTISHKSIGALIYKKDDKKIYGTAFLISKDLLLTAAHNVYDPNSVQKLDYFRFYLPSGQGKRYYKIKSARCQPQYQQRPSLEYDYALLQLQSPVLQFQQFMPIVIPCQKCLIQEKKEYWIKIFGYPGYQDNYTNKDIKGDSIILKQYGLMRPNRIIELKQKKISYKLSTLPGHSGSPIIYRDQIIGIHCGGGLEHQQFNVGRSITADLIQNLQNWKKNLKASEIKISQLDKCEHLKKRNGQLAPVNKIKSRVKETRQVSQDQLLLNEALNLFYKQEFTHSLQKLEICLTIKQLDRQDDNRIGILLHTMGIIYFRQSKYNKSIDKFQASLQNLIRNQFYDILFLEILDDLGKAYQKANTYRQAIKSFEKFIKNCEQVHYQSGILRCARWIMYFLNLLEYYTMYQAIKKKYFF